MTLLCSRKTHVLPLTLTATLETLHFYLWQDPKKTLAITAAISVPILSFITGLLIGTDVFPFTQRAHYFHSQPQTNPQAASVHRHTNHLLV